MKFYLLSDNIDTVIGMRLVGIPGELIRDEERLLTSLHDAMEREDVGIILVTKELVSMCKEEIYRLKLNCPRPLIVEIPDRHGGSSVSDEILNYVRDAVGINV